jgi:hypothetical protein
VPTYLRILHDMIARLLENKIRKREVSISTYTIRYDQPQTSFSRAPPPRESQRLFPRQILCQTLLTRAQGNHLGTCDEKLPAKNVLCENGNKTKSEGVEPKAWPRGAAFAECMWSARDVKSVDEAAPRLARMFCRLAARGFRASPTSAPARASRPRSAPPACPAGRPQCDRFFDSRFYFAGQCAFSFSVNSKAASLCAASASASDSALRRARPQRRGPICPPAVHFGVVNAVASSNGHPTADAVRWQQRACAYKLACARV